MFRELNEQLEKLLINEISDELKASYLAGRQAQLDKAQKAMEKARAQVKKSDARQVANLPQGIDKETATDALEALKSEMRRIDSGSDWRLEEQDNEMCLSVRYWGSWHGDDGSGDYDWQTLDDQYRDKLDGILTKIQKKYGVQIYEPGSEKNWLDFCIPITKMTKNSRLDYENEKVWKEFLDKNDGRDESKTMHINKGIFVANFISWNLRTYEKEQFRIWVEPAGEGLYTCKYKVNKNLSQIKQLVTEPSSFKTCLEAIQAECDKRNAKKNDPKRKKTNKEQADELWYKPLNQKNIPLSSYRSYYHASWKSGVPGEYFELRIKGEWDNYLCLVELHPSWRSDKGKRITVNFYATGIEPSDSWDTDLKKPAKSYTIDEKDYNTLDIKTWLKDVLNKAGNWRSELS